MASSDRRKADEVDDVRDRQRLDVALVARGLVATRSQARDLVLRGEVRVDGIAARRPSQAVPAGAHIEVDPAVAGLVSRGAIKLEAALAHFELSPDGLVAVDVGASTGGFTQTLLGAGAARVYAVDVGHGQLDARLRADPRVVPLEGCDARSLGRHLVPEPIGCIVADVSFVSLTKVLAPVLALADAPCWLVALIKPQFEAGRNALGKGGIVRDARDRQRAVDLVGAFMAAQPGWSVVGIMPSPIAGGSGNLEYLIGARRDG